VTDDQERLRAELQAEGDRLRAAELLSSDAHAAIAALLPSAIEAGLSKREIARLAGVGRPWIDKTLRRNA
jgi:hypothetical protein